MLFLRDNTYQQNFYENRVESKNQSRILDQGVKIRQGPLT